MLDVVVEFFDDSAAAVDFLEETSKILSLLGVPAEFAEGSSTLDGSI
jgi:hypothetical protein